MELLGSLWDLLKCMAAYLVGGFLWALAEAASLIVAAVSGLFAVALGLLPTVDLPDVAWPSWVASLNYFLPLEQFVVALGVCLGALLVWHLAVVPLRWTKAVE